MTEKIIYSARGAVLHVLEDGDETSSFQLPDYPEDLFSKDNLIIASMSLGLFCYDLSGNLIWKNNEFQGFGNQASIGENGVYVAHPELRTEVDGKNLESVPVMGEEFKRIMPEQADLWLASCDFNGKTQWFKFIQENAIGLKPLSNNKRLVVPFITQAQKNPSESKSGFHVLDLEGRLLKSVEENLFDFPMALVGDRFIYKKYTLDPKNPGKTKNQFLVSYDVEKLKQEFQIPVSSDFICGNNNFAGISNLKECCLIDDSVFMFCKPFIRRLDLKRQKITEYPVQCYLLDVLDDLLIVDEASPEYVQSKIKNNRLGLGKICAYDKDMKKKWEFQLPEEFRDNCYAVFSSDSSVYLSGWSSLYKISKQGKLESQTKITPSVSRIVRSF